MKYSENKVAKVRLLVKRILTTFSGFPAKVFNEYTKRPNIFTNSYDDFKKIFSGPDFRFKLLMQFSQARRDESIDISECRKYFDFRRKPEYHR